MTRAGPEVAPRPVSPRRGFGRVKPRCRTSRAILIEAMRRVAISGGEEDIARLLQAAAADPKGADRAARSLLDPPRARRAPNAGMCASRPRLPFGAGVIRARARPCCPACLGWAPFNAGEDRNEIQRCDGCHARGAGFASDTDAEIAAVGWLRAASDRHEPGLLPFMMSVRDAIENTRSGLRLMIGAGLA